MHLCNQAVIPFRWSTELVLVVSQCTVRMRKIRLHLLICLLLDRHQRHEHLAALEPPAGLDEPGKVILHLFLVGRYGCMADWLARE